MYHECQRATTQGNDPKKVEQFKDEQLRKQTESRRQKDIIQLEQKYFEQITKYRQEYDGQIKKLQLCIKELEEWNANHQEGDENSHSPDEGTNLPNSLKSNENQSQREEDIILIKQMYSEQITKYRQEYDGQIKKLQLCVKEFEEWNANHQEDELRKSIEVKKEVDDVDKDLLSHELEQAKKKLNWYNEKLKEYSDLQTNLDIIKTQNKQLENDLQIQQQTNQSNLQCIEEYEQTITQLQQEIDKKDKEIEESTSQLHLNNQHVKYLLLSYFYTSVNKREKMFPLLAALVGCTEEEYNEAINAESNNNNNGARSESTANIFRTVKIGISGFLNVKHRLKEIPQLHEEFRREIGTLFLDQLSISDGRPQPTAPQTSTSSLPHHSSEIGGASFR